MKNKILLLLLFTSILTKAGDGNLEKLKNSNWKLAKVCINGQWYDITNSSEISYLEFASNKVKFKSSNGENVSKTFETSESKIKLSQDSTGIEYNYSIKNDTLILSFPSKDIKTSQSLSIINKYIKQ